MTRPSDPPPERLPNAVGICPDHTDEFYVPLTLPLSTPFIRCPELGCSRYLALYVRAEK